MRQPAVAAAVACALVATVSACNTLADCFYGGECVAGACSCRPTWTGPNCSVLNLQPAQSGVAFKQPNSSSWGASVARAGGSFYMALSLMEGHCGLDSWESNSAIALARADVPEGPYELVGNPILLPPFAHNPTMHATSNGSLVIAHIGQGQPYHPYVSNCTNGTTPGSTGYSAQGTQAPSVQQPSPIRLGLRGGPLPPPNFLYLSSGDPGDGSAWEVIPSPGGIWAANNPALLLGANDSALLIYKVSCPCPGGCFCAQFGVATAPHWRGPYTDGGLIGVYGEDPYVWRDTPSDGGAFHLIWQSGSYPGTPAYAGHWHTAASLDGISWLVASAAPAFNGTIPLVGGGAPLQLGRRERHQLLFSADGAPAYLFNGATASGASGDASFSAVQPIATAVK